MKTIKNLGLSLLFFTFSGVIYCQTNTSGPTPTKNDFPGSGSVTMVKATIGTSKSPTTVGGESISKYSLFVGGGILSDEVRVRTTWADYVFNDNYSLKPLKEVKEFIIENGHLPNVPSAKMVENRGLEVGNISKIQQEKIEELFLHTINQQEEIERLRSLVDGLLKSKL